MDSPLHVEANADYKIVLEIESNSIELEEASVRLREQNF